MSNAFNIAAQMASSAIDQRHGEQFTFRAMKVAASVNLPRIADESREEFTVAGVFVSPPKSVFPQARAGVSDDHAHRTDITVPRISVDQRLLNWPVRQFDRVVRVQTGETFEVAKVMPGDTIRTAFHLTATKP